MKKCDVAAHWGDTFHVCRVLCINIALPLIVCYVLSISRTGPQNQHQLSNSCIWTRHFRIVGLQKPRAFLAKQITSWWFRFNPSEKYARQIGSFPQIGMKIKHIWNHHWDQQTYPNQPTGLALVKTYPLLSSKPIWHAELEPSISDRSWSDIGEKLPGTGEGEVTPKSPTVVTKKHNKLYIINW